MHLHTSPPLLHILLCSIFRMTLVLTCSSLFSQRGGHVLWVNEQNANTVLHVAARSGSVETVQFVLDYMQQYSPVAHSMDPMLFDINARNSAGATPLELAALEGTALPVPSPPAAA